MTAAACAVRHAIRGPTAGCASTLALGWRPSETWRWSSTGAQANHAADASCWKIGDNVTETQGWFLVIEVAVIALAHLRTLIGR